MNEFDKILKQKLQGYTETPPPEVFDNISSKLPKRTASDILSAYKYYFISAVAAVGIIVAVVFALLPSDEQLISTENNIVKNTTPDAPANLTDAAPVKSDNSIQLSSNESPNVMTSEFIAQSENKVDILDLKDTIICGNELLLDDFDYSNIKISNGLTISRSASGVKLYANTYGEHTVTAQNRVLKVTFVKPETIVASASKTNLCYGEKLTITTSESVTNLNWNNDGYSVARLGAGKFEITGLHSGDNSIIMTTASERCPSTISFNVNMAAKPVYALSTKPDFCSAANGEIAISTKSAVNYCRLNGGAESKNGTFAGLKAGKYIVEINYANSCALFDTVYVRENSGINATFESARNAFSDSKYDFTNTTKLNGQAADCLWFVNGVAVSSDFNLSYEFQENGKYTVDLVVSTGECESRHSETIVVNATKFRIPNVFTPNGDGKGDEFVIRYDGILSDYDLSVYSRSGQLVFHSQQIDKYWDGKMSGNNDASEGVYFYVVTATDENGDNITQKGTVQLLR